MAYQTLNPTTGEVLATFQPATDAEAHAALNEAADCARSWKNTPLHQRTELIRRVADLIDERRDELADLIALEMGKPVRQASGELGLSADIYRYYADNGERFTADEALDVASGGSAVIRTEPIGVLLGIMPWNYPHYQVARFAGPNLVLGNTVVIKHAANCPQSALAIEALFRDAGLPPGAYTNLFATHAQVATLIADPRVRGISLTGSEAAGAIVAEQAGRHLKKVVLELGGSDPFIVLDDARLERTIDQAVGGRFSNAGQACTSPKRFIVVDEVYDRFVAGFSERVGTIQPGDPRQAHTRFGPMSSAAARDEVLEQVQDAVSRGATLHHGGVAGEGAVLAPTLLTDLTPDMRAYSEELFGPVAMIHRVADADAAVAFANDSPYGLGAAVFCADPVLAQSVAERLEVGMVTIGGNSDSEPDLPFGGVKRSGFGRELGPHGMSEFANKKLIRVAVGA
ncbi:NAD-dependent succinate-semialdehyde dehydrogenase [Glaciibacter psychrotolerans]|uniref:Succinate-semialdehyde dehydrogenase/glutarate-semialdehyde dehydrogenase n=1 Tax=Glaciibacter psychrotolerans TaxID=670054 RepID=A0A7Z0EGJ7_9MICO|nr:NAD-dependent succinate-semialdehyde dehydrogenase [Leifsonia psychrotolerans]NYJ21106.1 succinate-semialdehyde dehydrogenase/glutarate-semialdehyde dehydrogenase [Leifsonia psychrotolerans]